MSDDINDQLVLISGESATGKSASLQHIPNGERVMYLNCESGKRLPFANKFDSYKITDPLQVYEAFAHANQNPDYDVIVVDTLTFLMDMYESTYVIDSENTMKAWGDYAQFFKNLMQVYVAPSDKSVIFLAHTREDHDEKAMRMKTAVPIKGALKNNGIESYFSTVVATKKVEIKHLEDQDPALCRISDHDRLLGYKHVFQTQLTADTIGERIRSPMGLFNTNQAFMDNDANLLLDHLKGYYA
jgi:hypothetical protein